MAKTKKAKTVKLFNTTALKIKQLKIYEYEDIPGMLAIMSVPSKYNSVIASLISLTNQGIPYFYLKTEIKHMIYDILLMLSDENTDLKSINTCIKFYSIMIVNKLRAAREDKARKESNEKKSKLKFTQET